MTNRSPTWRAAALGLLFCLWCLPCLAAPATTGAPSDSAGSNIAAVDVGLAGKFKVGQWTGVRVQLATPAIGDGESIILAARDVDGVLTRYEGPPLARGEQDVWRYVKFGHARASLMVIYRDASGVENSRPLSSRELEPAVSSASELLVTVGAPAGVEEAVAIRRRQGARVTVTARIERLADLPDHPLALSGVDTLILTTSAIDWQTAPPRQLAAIIQWVRLGGKLLLSAGEKADQVFAPGLLAALAPGEIAPAATLTVFPSLDALAGASAASPADVDQSPLRMAVVKQPLGRVEAAQPQLNNAPLVTVYPVGFGTVTYVAVDLDAPLLRRWTGRARLLNKLLTLHQASPQASGSQQPAPLPSQLGYFDLAGQLRTALDQYQQVRLVPFSWIAVLIVGFILLIGPADYFFLRRVAGRPTLTWLTLPLASLAVIGLAVWLRAANTPSAVLASQADVVDVDLVGGLERGHSWLHLYSPSAARWDIQTQITPALPASSAAESSAARDDDNIVDLAAGRALCWSGVAGSALGGLDGRAPPQLFPEVSLVSTAFSADADQDPYRGVPLATATSKALLAQWWRPVAPNHDVTLVRTADRILTGSIQNPLSVTLSDCILVYEDLHLRLPAPLKPGEVFPLGERPAFKTLQWQLTQRQTVEGKDLITAWDPRGRDVPRILEIMMLHQAAGGAVYTGLADAALQSIDLSQQLHLGRAMLIGRAPARPWSAALHTSAGKVPVAVDYDQSFTFYRIIVPVRAAGSSSRTSPSEDPSEGPARGQNG